MRLHRFMPVFPLLFAIYPVLNSYASNFGSLHFSQILRSLVLLPVATLTLWLAMNRLSKDSGKNAVLVSALLLTFFSYGSVYQTINSLAAPLFHVRHRFLIIIYCGIIVLGVALWTKMKKDDIWRRSVPYLNIIAAILIALVLFRIIITIVGHVHTRPLVAGSVMGKSTQQTKFPVTPTGKLPDIYYIILDGYGRADVLRDYYGYDNEGFITFLTSRGFYVASDSSSNYALTVLSLASSLNMEYLSYLKDEGWSVSACDKIVQMKVIDNKVLRTLQARDYSYIHFASGVSLTDDNPFADIRYRYGYLNPFETLLLDTTFIGNILATGTWAGRILYNFEELSSISKIKGPKFVFAHFVIPHPPNVFDRDGHAVMMMDLLGHQLSAESAMAGWDKNGYSDQVTFVNKKVESLVDDLLTQSDDPPIIILQGDHGPALNGVGGGWDHAYQTLSRGQWNLSTEKLLRERMSILNAYYLPGVGNSSRLYASITPVNSFRLILDSYLGTDFGLLEDKSYFSTYSSTAVFSFFSIPPAILKSNAGHAK